MEKQKTMLDFIAFLCGVELDGNGYPQNIQVCINNEWVEGGRSSLSLFNFMEGNLRFKHPETIIELPTIKKESDND